MCLFERVLCSRIEIDKFHFWESQESLRVFDHAVGRQAADQCISDRVGHGRHQPHTEGHEPDRDTGDQKHAALQSSLPGIAQHQLAVGGDVRAADLEYPAAPAGIGQRGDQVIDHILHGDRLGFVPHPQGTGHHREQLGHEANHLERDAARASDHPGAEFGDRNPALAQDTSRLDPRAHVRSDVLFRVCQAAQINNVLHTGFGRGKSKGARTFQLELGVSVSLRHVMDQIIGRLHPL